MSQPSALIYVSDDQPGIRRQKRGRGWSYVAPDGTRIADKAQRFRINALAIPPAYEDVWICPNSNGHLQATGRDARRRKQYRYHAEWSAYRARKKFDDLAKFGEALPRIRRAIRADLNLDAGDQAFAIAAVLTLMDRLSLRIGTSEYAKENKTFGATTLRSRHLNLTDAGLEFNFAAKGGKKVRKLLRDSRLHKIFDRLDDLPGATLISWMDGDTPRSVTSDQVNARLDDLTQGAGFTAKTFRTWNGSVAALDVAMSDDAVTIKEMSEAASERLHNTPTIARTSYIHPDIIALAGTSSTDRQSLTKNLPEITELRIPERALLSLLNK